MSPLSTTIIGSHIDEGLALLRALPTEDHAAEYDEPILAAIQQVERLQRLRYALLGASALCALVGLISCKTIPYNIVCKTPSGLPFATAPIGLLATMVVPALLTGLHLLGRKIDYKFGSLLVTTIFTSLDGEDCAETARQFFYAHVESFDSLDLSGLEVYSNRDLLMQLRPVGNKIHTLALPDCLSIDPQTARHLTRLHTLAVVGRLMNIPPSVRHFHIDIDGWNSLDKARLAKLAPPLHTLSIVNRIVWTPDEADQVVCEINQATSPYTWTSQLSGYSASFTKRSP